MVFKRTLVSVLILSKHYRSDRIFSLAIIHLSFFEIHLDTLFLISLCLQISFDLDITPQSHSILVLLTVENVNCNSLVSSELAVFSLFVVVKGIQFPYVRHDVN